MQGGNVLETFFEFNALLVTPFSLTIRHAHVVMFVRVLRGLWRFRFTYLSQKTIRPQLNAFRCALFALSVSYANWC